MNEMNQLAVDEILSLLEKNPIALVGAGISQKYFTDWAGLISELSNRLNIQCDQSLSPIDQAQLFYNTNRREYYNALNDVFGNYPEDCSDPLRDIVLLNFKCFITTNYDWSVELAFDVTDHPRPNGT